MCTHVVCGGYTGIGSLYIVIIAFVDIRLFVSGGEDEVSRWPSVSAEQAMNVLFAAP